jgi:NitT/TauT family transport system permease protein
MAAIAARLSRTTRSLSPTPQAERYRLRLPLQVRRTLVVAALFGVWEALTGGFGGLLWLQPAVNPALLPPPSAAFAELLVYARSGLLVSDMVTTLGAASVGLLLGLVGGFAAGVLLGLWRAAGDVAEPIFVALNSLPRVALAPVLVIWFALGITSKIVVSLLAVFFLVFFNTYLGVRSIDSQLVNAVRVMGASRIQTARMVMLPAVLEWVFAALRSSVSFGLTAVVVGEFVGATAGLGYRLSIASGVLNTPRVFAILLLLALIGTLVVEAAKCVERRLLHWQPKGEL